VSLQCVSILPTSARPLFECILNLIVSDTSLHIKYRLLYFLLLSDNTRFSSDQPHTPSDHLNASPKAGVPSWQSPAAPQLAASFPAHPADAAGPFVVVGKTSAPARLVLVA